MRLLRWFRAKNEAACESLAGHLPHTKVNIFRGFEDVVIDLMQRPDVNLVTDMGAGNFSPYAERAPQRPEMRLVGVDVSEAAMSKNHDVDEKLAADITKDLPFDDGEVDLVVSRSVLEHLHDVDAFVAETHRILRDGGQSVHLFTGRFAWFALLNRLLDHRIAKRILYLLHPESRGKGGFPTYYDRCYYSGIKRALERQGFEIVDIRVSYGTNYAYFFLPLFLLVSVYEIALQSLRLRNLGATFIVAARKGSREEGFCRGGSSR